MRVEAAELRVIRIALLRPFQTSFGTETERIVPILRLFCAGIEGVAEGVMDPLPLFREETTAGALDLLRTVILPRLLRLDLQSPHQLNEEFAFLRGNRMAKAVAEMAVWDLWSRTQAVPLQELLGGSGTRVAVGVSLGIQPSLEATVAIVEEHLTQGYQRIKLKIKPGWDLVPVAAVRAAFPQATLTVDANSAYHLTDTPHLRALDDFSLDYIEQPLAWDDLIDHASLQRELRTPLCLDESILSAADVRKAAQVGAGRVINLKVARLGGLSETIAAHNAALDAGIPVWCGGMLETGIGRAFNIHLATLPNFTKPGDTSSSSRYWERDIIAESLESSSGWMPVPPGPGTGVHLDLPFLDSLTLQKEWIRP